MTDNFFIVITPLKFFPHIAPDTLTNFFPLMRLPFVVSFLYSNKKGGSESFLNPPVHACAKFILFERVPTPFVGDFEGPQVEIDLHLEPALETFWHSPRVPAGPASAIFEII